MKKLGLLLVACFAFATISVAQNNIVKSLERNVPGQGKVTIHQDARIAALIGSEYVPAGSDEQKVIKSSGYRIQVYAGNNTRQSGNVAVRNICHMCLSVEGKHVMFAKREEINVFHNHHLTVFFLKLG